MNRNRFTILSSLTLLRQLSLHAGLVDEAHRDLTSSKVDALLEQLRDVIDGGHRALVFSQFTGFLRHVFERLDDAPAWTPTTSARCSPDSKGSDPATTTVRGRNLAERHRGRHRTTKRLP